MNGLPTYACMAHQPLHHVAEPDVLPDPPSLQVCPLLTDWLKGVLYMFAPMALLSVHIVSYGKKLMPYSHFTMVAMKRLDEF